MLLRTSRKTRDEEEYDGGLPIPTQLVSNGEYYPVPQTPRQKLVEDVLRRMADERAHALGWSRRRFQKADPMPFATEADRGARRLTRSFRARYAMAEGVVGRVRYIQIM